MILEGWLVLDDDAIIVSSHVNTKQCNVRMWSMIEKAKRRERGGGRDIMFMCKCRDFITRN